MSQIKTNMSPAEEKVIYNFLINFVLGRLKDLKPKHVHTYAKANKAIDPRIFFKSIPDNIIKKIRPAISQNKTTIDRMITYGTVLKHLKTRRPDLYQVLSIPQYESWFRKFLNLVKKAIFSM